MKIDITRCLDELAGSREEALRNAPAVSSDSFRVPRMS